MVLPDASHQDGSPSRVTRRPHIDLTIPSVMVCRMHNSRGRSQLASEYDSSGPPSKSVPTGESHLRYLFPLPHASLEKGGCGSVPLRIRAARLNCDSRRTGFHIFHKVRQMQIKRDYRQVHFHKAFGSHAQCACDRMVNKRRSSAVCRPSSYGQDLTI